MTVSPRVRGAPVGQGVELVLRVDTGRVGEHDVALAFVVAPGALHHLE
jgi:hypothetical protein